MEEVIHQHYCEEQTLHFSIAMGKELSLDEEENEPGECECRTEEDTVDGTLLDSVVERNPKMSCNGPSPNVTATTYNITSGSIIKNREGCQVLIQSILRPSSKVSPQYISRPKRSRACASYSTSAQITIYYYKSDIVSDLGKGVPVVLNFSHSDHFLKCYREGDNVKLSIECCDKSKLETICKANPATWPFVFYMTAKKSNCICFESAACTGWLIETESTGNVTIGKQASQDSMEFYFHIFPTGKTTPAKSM